MMDTLTILGRARQLFDADMAENARAIDNTISGARVLVYGGAGSIGKAVVTEIFRRQPRALHVIDISENNLVELVRDLRSSLGYIDGETVFLPLDMGSLEAAAFLASQPDYDYVLNLAAMKHVRSEKDAYSLMRMIKVNVLDTLTSMEAASQHGAQKYFAVSTDKAKNPANLMGATKRVMEDVLFRRQGATAVSTARFANVAFSDGSLLHGFGQRLSKSQPLSAPNDIRRYFVTGEESGRLCVLSLVLGRHREILFPKLDSELGLKTFPEIAERYLASRGFRAVVLDSEEEARGRVDELAGQGKWPCYFFASETSGEKPFEEFFSHDDRVDWERFEDVGVIQSPELGAHELARVEQFLGRIDSFRKSGRWSKEALVQALTDACPDLCHVETGRTLDNKM
jgi:UDP-N-acetylglucosamine 4,6-dehydratase